MKDTVEYQVFIGCRDASLHDEVESKDSLSNMVMNFFESKEVDFSLVSAKGGFLHEDGWYDVEDTLCINILGPSEIDIINLGRSLAMFMNQDCILVVKNRLQMEFR